jgi:hypothetical protein
MTRYHLLPALVLLLSFSACKKDSNPSSANGGSKDSTTNTTSPGSGKKGADFSTNMAYGTWNGDIVALKAFWYYTWGTPLPSPSPQNCEFVSMFWGAANVTTANIAAVKQLKAQGKAKYVLGFNEPNRSDQSNMTVSQALAFWPQLESIGLPLGSPAADWPTRQWIYDFLDSCIAEKKRVDFICVHMYVGTDDNGFVQTLQDLYNKYHLPIWITEFATADWNATTPSANAYPPDQVLAFMQRLLPKLEALSFVQRYSWFSGDPKGPQLWSSALIDASGNLTALGSWYAGYQPNTAIAK